MRYLIKLFVCILLVLLLHSGVYAHQPHDPILSVELSPNFHNDGTLFAVLDQKFILFKSVDGGKSFYSPSDPLSTKHPRIISCSPSYAYDNTVFVATEKDGLFKSIDGGESWVSVNNGITDKFITSIGISPASQSEQTIIVGTHGGKLFQSIDGGEFWSEIILGYEGIITDIVFSPAFVDDKTLFISVQGVGIVKSLDAGQSWVLVNTGLTNYTVTALAISPEFPLDDTIYASTWGGGVCKSTDEGESWFPINFGLKEYLVSDIEIAPEKTLFTTLNTEGVFRSSNGGMEWKAVNRGLWLSDQNPYHFRDIAISQGYPSDKTVFLGAFEGLYISYWRGSLWRETNLVATEMNRQIAVCPDFSSEIIVFLGTYGGGFMKSLNTGRNWMVMNRGLGNTFIDPLVISPNYLTDETILLGTSLGVYKSTDGGQNWTYSPLVPGKSLYVRRLAISPNYHNDQVVFATSHSLSYGKQGIFRSEDGGETWLQSNSGLPPSPMIESITISPSYPSDHTVFIGLEKAGVYKSTNGGQQWSPAGWGIENLTIKALQVTPNFASDQTLFAGSHEGLFKSTDGGASWKLLDIGLPFKNISAIGISPNYSTDSTIFVGVGVGGVYKSIDGGTSWMEVNSGLLPNIIRDIQLSPTYYHDQAVFLGTYNGAYCSFDGGLNWTEIQQTNRYENHSDFMYFQGSWRLLRNPDLSGSTLHYTDIEGQKIFFEFSGSSLRWIASKGPSHGKAYVYLDGIFFEVVDLYDSALQTSVPVLEIDNIVNGWHLLTIEVSGEKNLLSSANYITIDAIDVSGYK
jgi:photosystem II stability/assembly factor-like uncharacterized protein